MGESIWNTLAGMMTAVTGYFQGGPSVPPEAMEARNCLQKNHPDWTLVSYDLVRTPAELGIRKMLIGIVPSEFGPDTRHLPDPNAPVAYEDQPFGKTVRNRNGEYLKPGFHATDTPERSAKFLVAPTGMEECSPESSVFNCSNYQFNRGVFVFENPQGLQIPCLFVMDTKGTQREGVVCVTGQLLSRETELGAKLQFQLATFEKVADSCTHYVIVGRDAPSSTAPSNHAPSVSSSTEKKPMDQTAPGSTAPQPTGPCSTGGLFDRIVCGLSGSEAQ